MAERYVPLEVRAADLIEKGRQAWQDLQRVAMAEDDVFDSLVLLGQDLWLPHHEGDLSTFRVTLRVAVCYPEAGCAAVEALAADHFARIEGRWSDGEGAVRIAIQPQ